jgi:hypothetical protein
MRTTMTGVFRDPEAALRVSEELRELVGAAGAIRLFLPTEDGSAVEMAVVEERSPWLRTVAWGLATGLVFSYVSLSIARSWLYASVALASGGLFGVLLGSWLGGQRYRRTVRPHMRSRYFDLARKGRAVLLVEVSGSGSESVRQSMEGAGAYVSEGYWPVRDSLQPV